MDTGGPELRERADGELNERDFRMGWRILMVSDVVCVGEYREVIKVVETSGVKLVGAKEYGI